MTISTGKRGRPPGAQNLKPIVQAFAAQKIAVGPDGQEITVAEAVLIRLRDAYLKGNRKAEARLDKLRERIVPREDGGVLVMPDQLSPEEWVRRAEISNEYREMPTLETLDAAVHEITGK